MGCRQNRTKKKTKWRIERRLWNHRLFTDDRPSTKVLVASVINGETDDPWNPVEMFFFHLMFVFLKFQLQLTEKHWRYCHRRFQIQGHWYCNNIWYGHNWKLQLVEPWFQLLSLSQVLKLSPMLGWLCLANLGLMKANNHQHHRDWARPLLQAKLATFF